MSDFTNFLEKMGVYEIDELSEILEKQLKNLKRRKNKPYPSIISFFEYIYSVVKCYQRDKEMNFFSGKYCAWCGREIVEEPRIVGSNGRSMYHLPCYNEMKDIEKEKGNDNGEEGQKEEGRRPKLHGKSLVLYS
jgi:hypothetical protein